MKKNQSWITRNWRPLIMLLFGVIIVNNYLLAPWCLILFNINIKTDIPPQMWEVLKLGIGVYISGRSIEKGIKIWTDGS